MRREGKTAYIKFFLTPSMKAELERVADEREVSAAHVIREAIREAIRLEAERQHGR
jgi:hypothetical protein